jgi:thiol-disulfide isomerase/thioredoxin
MKKRSLALFLIASLTTSFANARLTDNQTLNKIEKNILRIESKKNFHLNAQAPATATFDSLEAIYKPTLKTEAAFEFKIPEKTKLAKVNFYVCDDKKTVCEQHQENIALDGKQNTLNEVKSSESTTLDVKASLVEKGLKDLVSKNEKPTLLVFSAPWCPACIRMHTETYNQNLVKTQLSKLNFIQLNSDLPENSELSDLFHVRAIPTLVLLSAAGEEVYRWLDFQQPTSFAKSLAVEIKKISQNKNSLVARASLADPEAISEAGMMAYNTLNYEEAIKWFSLSKKTADVKYKLAAEVNYWQEAADKDENKIKDYLQTLQKGLFLTDSKIDQLRWLVEFIEKKKETEKLNSELKLKAQQSTIELENKLKNKKVLAEEFKQSTFGESAGFEEAEIRLMRSRLFAALDQKEEKEKSDQAIIQLMKNKKVSVEKPGEMLITIAYLREAGETELVIKMYQKLIQKYSKTYVYYEKYSRFLLKNKHLEIALPQVNFALQFPEGNEPQLYLLKARILKELNLKNEMLVAIDQALKQTNIQHPRFKNTVAQLNKLKTEASSEQIKK